MRWFSLGCALGGFLAIASAEAAPIKATSITASSTYPADGNVNYDPRNLMDGKQGTSWVEGDEGSGLGSWVELDLGEERSIDRIRVWHGMWYSYDYFQRGNRPRELELKFSDGSTQTAALTDAMEIQDIAIAPAKTTSSVRLRVKQVYAGTTWSDTALSEIQVFDTAPSPDVVPASYATSSKLAPDNDGSYEPENMADGLADSMWCEGDEGDGAGQWVEFRFGGPTEVSKLKLINGVGSSIGTWMKANRTKTATLAFSDGSTEDIAIRGTALPQTVDFPAHTTNSVRLTFTEITAGKEFNDLCLSEARFQH